MPWRARAIASTRAPTSSGALGRLEDGVDLRLAEGAEGGVDQELLERREVQVDGAARDVGGFGDVGDGGRGPLGEQPGVASTMALRVRRP
jgi:hypothetical protein